MDWVIAAALFAVSIATRAAFVYRGGMAEADSVAISAGLARSFSADVSFGDCILYGRQTGPGIYLVFKMLSPLFVRSPAQVIPLLNWIGVLSASLLVFPLYLLFRRSLSACWTAAGVILFLFSPLVWETGISFNSILPALLLLSLACLAWKRIDASSAGVAWFAMTSLLAAGAVVMRMETLMAVPAVIAAVLVYGRRRGDMPLLAAVLAIAVGAYVLVVKALPGSHRLAGKGVFDFAEYFIQQYRETLSIRGLGRTVSWFVMGAGVGTVGLAVMGIVFFLRHRVGGRGLIVALSLALPALVLWLVQPGGPILRHYYHVIPAVAWIAVAFLPGRFSRGASLAIVTAAVVCNLAIPEALYRAYNARHPLSMNSPNGTFFYYRQESAKRIARYHDLQAMVRSLVDRGAGGGTNERQAGGEPEGGEAGARGALVPVNWESYAYLLYGLAQDRRLVKISETMSEPDLFFHRYALGDAEVQMVFANRFSWNSLPRTLEPFLREAGKAGYAVFLPRELLAPGAVALPAGVSYIPY